jgi:hypothetical protein
LQPAAVTVTDPPDAPLPALPPLEPLAAAREPAGSPLPATRLPWSSAPSLEPEQATQTKTTTARLTVKTREKDGSDNITLNCEASRRAVEG